MKQIRIIDDDSGETHDLRRIQEIFVRRGYIITLNQARALWQGFSDSMCAGWMRLPDDDDEVFATVSIYFEEL